MREPETVGVVYMTFMRPVCDIITLFGIEAAKHEPSFPAQVRVSKTSNGSLVEPLHRHRTGCRCGVILAPSFRYHTPTVDLRLVMVTKRVGLLTC